MIRYTWVAIAAKIQYACETLGMKAYSRAMRVITVPCVARMRTSMPLPLTRWK